MKTINERDADMIESIEMWLHEIEPKWVEKELTWLGDLRTRLAEEPVSDCNDLEDEIDRVIADYSFTKTIDSGGFKTTVLDYEKIARYFAEWGAEHLRDSTKKISEDIALTIDDIEKLHTFLYAVKNNKQGAFTFTHLSDEQYEEVLRRFNKTKEQ